MEYLHEPDDGSMANKLLEQHPELDENYVKKLADKGTYIKRISSLINVKAEEFVEAVVNIQPRLNFDVSDFVTNAYSASEKNDKVINVFLFSENVDEKLAIETLEEFNNIGFNSKTVMVFRSKLLGLSKGLDLFLSDYVSYSAKVDKSENVLRVNPSKLIFALGAGCSIDANIGSWQQLNDALSFELLTSDDNYGLTNYGIKEVNENVLDALSKSFDKNSLIDIAIRKKKETEEKTSMYFNYVHDILYMNYDETNFDYKTSTLISISNCIKRIKMKKVITYNFDSTLKKNINWNIIGLFGIAYTRWHTYGNPKEYNAHPHYSDELTSIRRIEELNKQSLILYLIIPNYNHSMRLLIFIFMLYRTIFYLIV